MWSQSWLSIVEHSRDLRCGNGQLCPRWWNASVDVVFDVLFAGGLDRYFFVDVIECANKFKAFEKCSLDSSYIKNWSKCTCSFLGLICNSKRLRSLKNLATCWGSTERRIGAEIGANKATLACLNLEQTFSVTIGGSRESRLWIWRGLYRLDWVLLEFLVFI